MPEITNEAVLRRLDQINKRLDSLTVAISVLRIDVQNVIMQYQKHYHNIGKLNDLHKDAINASGKARM